MALNNFRAIFYLCNLFKGVNILIITGIMQTIIHYTLHFIAPLLIAVLFFRSEWRKAYVIMLATMLVDLDHLLVTPIFEANRCSINFHPLHTYYAMLIYVGLLFLPRFYKIIGIGLLFHMLTDYIDCQLM